MSKHLLLLGLAAFVLAACSSNSSKTPPPRANPTSQAVSKTKAVAAKAAPKAASQPASRPAPKVKLKPAAEVAREGDNVAEAADFIDEARRLTALMACSKSKYVTKDERRERRHCKRLRKLIKNYRERWVSKLEAFMQREVPQQKVPKTVIYPFGGSDLFTVLATYPHLEEATILALERAGDPRPIRELKGPKLGKALELLYQRYRRYVRLAYSTTVGLEKIERSSLTSVLTFNLQALYLRGFVPVSLRYFTLKPDGTVHYITKADIAASDRLPLAQRRKRGKAAIVFKHMELRFRKKGTKETPRVFRHISLNLEDRFVAKRPGVRAYLEKRARVSGLVKAGSYLLWRTHFSWIRNYMLKAPVFIVSDSSGPPPYWAKDAGFEQKTFGTYKGAYFVRNKTPRAAVDSMVALWKSQPQRPLPFRFGYPDRTRKRKYNHLMISKKTSAGL